VTFQLTDIPRLLPELMLLVLALLVLGSDILERWGNDPASQIERSKASGQLTAIGLGLVFLVGLVQSKYLFTVGENVQGGAGGVLAQPSGISRARRRTREVATPQIYFMVPAMACPAAVPWAAAAAAPA